MRQPISGNKAQYSLDCDDGIEYSACLHEPTPQELLDRMELFVHLWNALNSLPEVQGVRVEAHLILGKSYRQIAREQGVDKSAVRHSVKSGKAVLERSLTTPVTEIVDSLFTLSITCIISSVSITT